VGDLKLTRISQAQGRLEQDSVPLVVLNQKHSIREPRHAVRRRICFRILGRHAQQQPDELIRT
jgi:hypothetical protein